MALTFKINSRDYEPYLRLQHSEGFDPVDADRIEPQFAGNLALSEGMNWVRDSAGNREWLVPLHLTVEAGQGADDLMELVRDIRSDLFKGAQVEFKLEGSTQSTFFDLERGRLDEQFEYFIVAHNSLRAVLRLWTRPYGHTGTDRLVASIAGSGAVNEFSLASVAGDVPALGDIRVQMGGHAPPGETTPRVVAWGFHPCPSFVGAWPAASLTAQLTATISGEQTAIGSQWARYRIVPTQTSGQEIADLNLDPALHYGRHRVLIGVRHQISPASAVSISLNTVEGATLSARSLPSHSGLLNELVDLGEITVPTHASGMPPPATYTAKLFLSGASGASAVATYPFRILGVVLVPLDLSAGMVIKSHTASTPGIEGGDWTQFRSHPAPAVFVGTSSVKADLTAQVRGGDPRVGPTPSHAVRGVAINGLVLGHIFNPSGGKNVEIRIREQFQFLR